MQKNRFRDLVRNKLSGGFLNEKSQVDSRIIDAYMPAAVNEVMMEGYGNEVRMENDRDFSSIYYFYYPSLTISVDATRHNWKYINDPAIGIALPRNQDIRTVEDNLGNLYSPLPDNAMTNLNYYLPLMGDLGFYRRAPKGKIYLFNLPELAKTINLSRLVDAGSLADTDELPIPAGLESKAIDICFQYVIGVREVPADRVNDQRDIN